VDTRALSDAAASLLVAQISSGRHERWLRHLVKSGAWQNFGVAVSFERKLIDLIPSMRDNELLSCAVTLQQARADRSASWANLVAECQRRLSRFSPEDIARFLHVQARSTWPQPHGLFTEAADVTEGRLAEFPVDALAEFMRAFARLASPGLFQSLIRRNTDALKTALARENASPPLLYSLANGMLTSQRAQVAQGMDAVVPCWWSKLVNEPWSRVLSSIVDVLRRGPHGYGDSATYVQTLQRFCLSDVGKHFTLNILPELQVSAPSDTFLQKAAAAVRKARDEAHHLADGAVHRALDSRGCGFVSFRFLRASPKGVSVLAFNPGRVLWSGPSRPAHRRSRRCHDLVTVPIGFIENRHPRDGDIELRALQLALECLGAARVGDKELTGDIDIFVDRTPCLSCIGALVQFQALKPGVRVRVGFEERLF